MKSLEMSHVYRSVAVAAIVITATLAGHAHAQSKVLTDKAGMTVYTFDQDAPGKSACYGECAAAWPPVKAGSLSAGSDLSVVSRNDGTQQVAYKGKPLYLFVGDRKPGDVTGDKVQNVWHVVRSAGKTAAEGSSGAAASAGASYGY